jgi:DNA-binding CsgD family transcriptional regulator
MRGLSESPAIIDPMTVLGPSPVFVGRDRELRLLLDHAGRVRTGAPGTLLIGGDAGVGKSRLLAEYVRRGATGRVLAGGCLELGVDGLPFAPFVAVLRHLLRDTGRAPFDALAHGGDQELARLLPELGPAPTDRREARSILFEHVLRVLSDTAGPEGTTVVVEDLHWADNATRDLLVFLIRNLDSVPVQILATYRTDDLHRRHPLRRLLPELERLPDVGRVELGPLGPAEVAAQAAAIRGRPLRNEEAAALHARSDGIPLFVESLAEQDDLLAAPVPDGPRELLLGPLHRLDDRARLVAQVAAVGAVSGGHIEHALLARAADLPEDGLEEALHAVVDANVLRVDGTGYRFRHALLREAVHDELLPGRHVRLHLRYAEALETLPGAVPAHRLAAEQAHHYHSAHELPRALSAAWWAAVHAAETLAFAEELRMLERVLELWDRVPDAVDRVEGHSRVEVLRRAADAALEGGEVYRARELCDAALAEVPEDAADDASRGLRGVLLRLRGQARTKISDGDGMVDLVAALAVHPPHVPGYANLLSYLAREVMLRREVLTVDYPGLAGLAGLGRRSLSADELARQALRHAEAEDDHCARSDALITLGSMGMNTGDAAEGERLLRTAIELARERRDPSLEMRGVADLSHFLREVGAHGPAADLLRPTLDRARELRLMSVNGAFMALNLAEVHFDLGDVPAARHHVDLGFASLPSPQHTVYLAALDVRVALAEGRADAARARAAELDPEGAVRTSRIHAVLMIILALADLRTADGDPEAALGLVADTLRRVEPAHSPGYAWAVLEVAGEALARAGDAAERLHGPLTATAAGLPVRGPVQAARRAVLEARLAVAGGADAAAAADAWKAALAACDAAPGMRLLRAGALLGAAESAAAGEDRAAAADLVGAAAALAAECGATALERRAGDLARRVGAPGTAAPAGPAGLTPRETEVLRLLARGRTNAEIAGELFISAKTASVHVSHILAKLGLPNRGAAGARARELGIG